MFEILNSINRSADFYACQSSKAFFPELQIEGLGELALPLCDAQAEQLIQLCSRAPYGKGTQTLVDESVRKVWELDSSKISSGNQAWQRFIKRILRHYEEVLDLQGQTLIAHPYKLLLYDAGSFFLSHQDSEKEDGMVATLVITLPSAHEGGELTIRHRNQSVSIDFSSQAKRYDFQSVLFYADCQHEIAPLKSGYRLALTYNVCLQGVRGINSPDFGAQEQALTSLITDWKKNLTAEDDKYQLISLDHQYSADGFSLDTLKGVDRTRADALLHAASQADCEAYICLLETYEIFDAWDEDNPTDLIDGHTTLDHFFDVTGNPVELSISNIDDDMILRQYTLEDEEAIDQDYEGYTGNAGNTLSRWYRYAAVILWPRECHLEMLAYNSTQAAIDYLKVGDSLQGVSISESLHSLMLMADNGKCRPHDKYFDLLKLILKSDDPKLATIYCRRFLLAQEKLPAAEKIQTLFARSGWEDLQQTLDLGDSFEAVDVRGRFLKMLTTIDTSKLWDQHPALTQLFSAVVTKISDDVGWRSNASDNFKLIFPLCLEQTTKQSVETLAGFLHKQSDRLSALRDVLPYIEEEHSSKANVDNAIIFEVVTRWLNAQFSKQRQLAKQAAPEPALVETIPEMDCACEDCQAVLRFMQSDRETIELPRLKAKCEHLTEQVERYEVQVIHSINRNRRPFRFNMRKLGAD
ncbi:MAG: 2OG-Fe(II) oxygenase, partial [Thiolinea sp.]